MIDKEHYFTMQALKEDLGIVMGSMDSSLMIFKKGRLIDVHII